MYLYCIVLIGAWHNMTFVTLSIHVDRDAGAPLFPLGMYIVHFVQLCTICTIMYNLYNLYMLTYNYHSHLGPLGEYVCTPLVVSDLVSNI